MCTTIAGKSNFVVTSVNTAPIVNEKKVGPGQGTESAKPSVTSTSSDTIKQTASQGSAIPTVSLKNNVITNDGSVTFKKDDISIRFIRNESSTQSEIDIYSKNKQNKLEECRVIEALPANEQRIFFVNGVKNELRDAAITRNKISEIIGSEIPFIYNPTEGAVDFANAGLGNHLPANMRKPAEFEAVLADEIHNLVTGGKKVKIIAHSEGAVLTANALQLVKDRLIDEGLPFVGMMMNIQVLTLGGFASPDHFPKDIQLAQVTNKKDPIPALGGSPLSTNKIAENYRHAKALGATPQQLQTSLSASQATATSNIVFSVAGGLISFDRAGGTLKYHSAANYLQDKNVGNLLKEFKSTDLNDIASTFR